MPILLIYGCQRVPLLDKLGVVVLAFAVGISLSAVVDLNSLFAGVSVTSLQTQVTEITIALAIPMLVFSIDVKRAFTMAGSTMKSMAVALTTVMFMSAILAYFFNERLDNIWQIAGMAVGAYTGGGPNMAAIKTAIDGDQAVFVTMTSYDILLSSLYLIFVMTIAKPLFSRVLPPFQSQANIDEPGMNAFEHISDESANAYRKLVTRKGGLETIQILFFAGLVVAISAALASLLPHTIRSTATIILITTMGLAFSFIPYIRALKNSFQLGMYLILVFCFTMGSMTDLSILTNLNIDLFLYIGFILLGSLCVHALFCRFLKIDIDTFLITSSAAIMSVPFIPVIAGALKNRQIILPGFAAAILGYVLGNYLGVTLAYLTRWLLT
jgi:uncharacterized membrane protein